VCSLWVAGSDGSGFPAPTIDVFAMCLLFVGSAVVNKVLLPPPLNRHCSELNSLENHLCPGLLKVHLVPSLSVGLLMVKM